MRIAIIPTGQWGEALGVPFADNGHEVWLYFRLAEELQHHVPHDNLHATAELGEALENTELIVLACPAQHMREVLSWLPDTLDEQTLILNIAKGIEAETGLRMSELITTVKPTYENRVATLSGPNFAAEVVRRLPAATVIASTTPGVAKKIQAALRTPWFRVYTSADLVGVELGGVLKNIVAIAAGISDGLGLGGNARAALTTRHFAEMVRFSMAYSGKMETLYGLSGLGDLLLTTTGALSRNHTTGMAIGEANAFNPAMAVGKTVEGLASIPPVLQLAAQKRVEMPLTQLLSRVINNELTPREAFSYLMNRDSGEEWKK